LLDEFLDILNTVFSSQLSAVGPEPLSILLILSAFAISIEVIYLLPLPQFGDIEWFCHLN